MRVTDISCEKLTSHLSTAPVTGDADPVAPPLWAEQLRAALPNALHLTVPGAGHTEETPCIERIRAQFFRAGTVRGLDTVCMVEVQPWAFEP